MAIDEKPLTKGQKRKLNALRKSIGDKLGNEAFAKWIKEQAKKAPVKKTDPVADKLSKAFAPLRNDKSIKLGNRGYSVRRARGKGAKGFVIGKIK